MKYSTNTKMFSTFNIRSQWSTSRLQCKLLIKKRSTFLNTGGWGANNVVYSEPATKAVS